jgi:hypothetical protein
VSARMLSGLLRILAWSLDRSSAIRLARPENIPDCQRCYRSLEFGALTCIAHKSLKSCEQCRRWRQNPPLGRKYVISQRRDDFYNCSRNCSSRFTPPIVSPPSCTVPTRQGLHRGQFFSVRQTHRLGRAKASRRRLPYRSVASPTGCFGLTFCSKITQMAALDRSQ